uniref:Nicotianamine synthase n=1 Tax=Aegilops tauschii TaxID=37682 RepID=R7W562_AEGTA
MDAQNKEVAALVEKITGLHAAIAKLPSLSPSPAIDALFTELVTACAPPSPVDVTKLGPEAQEMREGLIRLCSEAEGKLEAHYSDMLAAFDNPLDHLGVFPYYSNYVNLSKLRRAGKLFRVDTDVGARMSFHTAEVLAVCHPDDDVVNSVIIAHKSKDVGRHIGGGDDIASE